MGTASSLMFANSFSDSMEAFQDAIDPFGHGYRPQRTELRQRLIETFAQDPSNRDILDKLLSLRLLVVKEHELCFTAKQEYENLSVEANPTNKESAFRELERLYTIYETGRILKSVRCRLGPVACPLEHHMTKRLVANRKRDKYEEEALCSICQRNAYAALNRYMKYAPADMYHCSYCQYNLCQTCSVVYCCWGHGMTLWTNPEALHTCVVCKEHKISAGYRCVPCSEEHNVDYNICDRCTHTWGRREIQQVICERMKKYLDYMDKHVMESATAKRTSENHHKKMATNTYDSTLELYNFSHEIKELKIIAVAEVKQSRLTKEILRIRAILEVGYEYGATARREWDIKERPDLMWVPMNPMYTDAEKLRLQDLERQHFREKSQAVRCNTKVGCVLGHAMFYYEGIPKLYAERDKATISPFCKICDRLADKGYHCYLCEYDLCMSCSTMYCGECHCMPMWTVPEAAVTCSICHTEDLSAGYYCSICDINICDQCTNRETRKLLYAFWQAEIVRLMNYFHDNRLFSDVAMYYDWRKVTYIVSPAILIEMVRELKMAKVVAMTQVKYRNIILNIKKLRLMVIALNKPSHPCNTAIVEAEKDDNYFFRTRSQADRELKRLGNLLIRNNFLKSLGPRHKAGIACPLGHAMEEFIPNDSQTDEIKESETAFAANINKLAGFGPLSSDARQYDGNNIMSNSENANIRKIEGKAEEKSKDVEKDEKSDGKKEEHGHPVNMKDFDDADYLLELGLGDADDGADESSHSPDVAPRKNPDYEESKSSKHVDTDVASSKSNKSKKSKKSKKKEKMSKEEEDKIIKEEDYRNSVEYRTVCAKDGKCRTCAFPINDCPVGYFCAYCDYAICNLCRVVYCREGHSCQIWTFQDAVGTFCNICTTPDIAAGYHCTTCNMDICDDCTNRGGRFALKNWHERSLKKIVGQLQALPKDVEVVKTLIDRFNDDTEKSYLRTMRDLLEELSLYQNGYKQALVDTAERNKSKAHERYVLFNNDA